MTALFSEIAQDTSPRGVIRGQRARWAILTAFGVFAALGLIGLFGQRESETAAAADAATLRLSGPRTIRGGLYFQSRVEIRALRAIEHPRLVLDAGWIEGMQVNSIEPNPVSEASREGRVVLSYDGLDPGERLVVWLQFQVNPTNVGRRSYDVELDDGDRPLTRVGRDITVLP